MMQVRATVLEIAREMQPSEWAELFQALRDELVKIEFDDCEKILEQNDRSDLNLLTSDDGAEKSSSERTETGRRQRIHCPMPSMSLIAGI
jgi:hypothetical protein